MKTLSIVNTKGGAGKTSLAVTLAYLLGRSNSVCLIDLDPSRAGHDWVALIPAEVRGELTAMSIESSKLEAALGELFDSGCDYCLIDTPAGNPFVTQLALGYSDLGLIPLHIGGGDIAQLVEMNSVLKLPRAANPALEVRAVINHTGRMTRLLAQTRRDVSELGLAALEQTIPFLVRYADSRGGTPATEHYELLLEELRAGGLL